MSQAHDDLSLSTHLPLVPHICISELGYHWFQVMACRLFGTKPLPEPMMAYCQLDSQEQISVKFKTEFSNFHSRKCIWKCRLPKWQPFCPRGDEISAWPPAGTVMTKFKYHVSTQLPLGKNYDTQWQNIIHNFLYDFFLYHCDSYCIPFYFNEAVTWANQVIGFQTSRQLFKNTYHTMDLLWERFQWILPLYMKPISFQAKASVVCSVTVAIFIEFCLKKLNVFSQHIGKKKWISEFRRTNPEELKYWSTFCVDYFLRYYLMMQHQPIVKRVNGMHGWAHRPYQLLSAPYHCCLYKHRRQDARQPLQSSWPVPICT